MSKVKVRRADLKPGEVLCTYCTARCCRYFALPIETPTTWGDFDHMRWYIMHGRTAIFVDGGTWFLLVFGDCQNLLEDNRCGIYHTRPEICGAYSTDNCEYDNDGCYDKFFESPDQIWEYAEAVLPPKPQPRKKAGAANLPALPVLS
jgi:Fe-S-cluster containining protein